jgi:endonuclease/exonuclease/phosphatase family metal-dependent hydrolase
MTLGRCRPARSCIAHWITLSGAFACFVACAGLSEVDGPDGAPYAVDATGQNDASESDDAAAPDAPDARQLRMMTYNIKHAGLSSLEALAEVVLAEAPDLVCLQEVDKEAERSGGVLQSYRLGQLTGMASLFRMAIELPDGGLYGLAFLSRFPILSSQKTVLTSTGEQRILVVATVDLGDGRLLGVANTHLGLDASERATQAAEISAVLAGQGSVVLMGDFNEEPGDGAVFETLGEHLVDVWPIAGVGDGATIPVSAPTRRIDAILLSHDWPAPEEAHVPDTLASDHLPVVVTVSLPAGP